MFMNVKVKAYIAVKTPGPLNCQVCPVILFAFLSCIFHWKLMTLTITHPKSCNQPMSFQKKTDKNRKLKLSFINYG